MIAKGGWQNRAIDAMGAVAVSDAYGRWPHAGSLVKADLVVLKQCLRFRKTSLA